ncbi:hypothetical protein Q4566_00020 [Tamlana sp. 2_MG-2023]|uniref:hypothetical protein n=1 Tax=unclassified Tamlana TaxID=2614803 RepID=UPI0026E28CCF|nr:MULTISPECIES: hypothetical protein [unclassified Tamlana]MDO6758566.1 hypothetical protein [Tamlana sp. 2_MG-2023]MDO6789265.1 hypothetical protein [Tamlana sp. 1_MG-2023]
MIKAGSIAYAILICIVVGVFCYALLMISSYSKMHQTMLFTSTELHSNNESAKQYFLSKANDISQNNSIDLFDNGIVSSAEVKPWGFYQILVTTSNFKTDTIRQTVLIGEKQQDDGLALYLTDNNKALFMVGKAIIKGNVFIPKKGIKQGYITSNAYTNTKILLGSKSVSKAQLPELKTTFFKFENQQTERIDLRELSDSIKYYQSFAEKTLFIDAIETELLQKKLSGNIVIESKDSLYIKKNNVLDNVIVKAPKVVFESGFKGSVQVVADQLVVLEENVILKYPSGIFIHHGETAHKEIRLKNSSKLLGAIVLDDQNRSADKLISIEENVEIVGDVYCSGEIALEGSVIGTVYTNSFYLRTDASIYDNYIMDGVIDKKNLPDNFLKVSLFNNINKRERKYAIITPL